MGTPYSIAWKNSLWTLDAGNQLQTGYASLWPTLAVDRNCPTQAWGYKITRARLDYLEPRAKRLAVHKTVLGRRARDGLRRERLILSYTDFAQRM